MATRKGNFITGSIQNVVFKKRGNKQTMQSAPGKGGVKQTKATKKVAIQFGKASSLGKHIRFMFREPIFGFYDGAMINRLNIELHAILRNSYRKEANFYQFSVDSFSKLQGFNFNIKSQLNQNFWLEPESSLTANLLKITLPELKIPEQLKFPENTISCEITIATNFFCLSKGYIHKSAILQILTINNDQFIPGKHEFDFAVPDGCLCIATISLKYFTRKYTSTLLFNNKEFNPAEICAAYVTPGTFAPQNITDWDRVDNKFPEKK
ncbi:hypothetical protein H7F33_18805 [Pedobacter sp. PAMC26386]|nr:hypothetical protein H7F33_18805 [Pedobacter sp. PAMC26386]